MTPGPVYCNDGRNDSLLKRCFNFFTYIIPPVVQILRNFLFRPSFPTTERGPEWSPSA